MGVAQRARPLLRRCQGWLCWTVLVSPALGQGFFGFSNRFELSDTVHVDEVDATTKSQLERVKALLVNKQWDEAVETLRTLVEADTGKVVAVSPRRYVPLADYCHGQLAALPADALALYRGRVDSQAEKWLTEGVERRDEELLERVVRQCYCSSTGDKALSALGELALERGDYGAARGYWEQLIETPPLAIGVEEFQRVRKSQDLPPEDAARLDRWYRADSASPQSDWRLVTERPLGDAEARALVELWRTRGFTQPRLAYPGTKLSWADIRARLVLVSILEGSQERARAELASYAAMYPTARGTLGGREVVYREGLESLASAAASWQQPAANADWPTFAGSPARNKTALRLPDVAPLGPHAALPSPPVTDSGYPSPRVAETRSELLSYHPLVAGRLVLLNTQHDIRAYDLATLGAAWGTDPVIYKPRDPPTSHMLGVQASLGAARFTMTEHGGRLYARMGDLLTGRPEEMPGGTPNSHLVCIDLAGEGRLIWGPQQPPLEERWAFEGAPVCDGEHLYVALRRSEVRPQAHVACYDARTGRLVWRRFVCSAETPARGQIGECTHSLLTLDRDRLYFNTNLGAVACLETRGGNPRWITTYPRAKSGDLNQRAAHFYRDLTPCVYDRGRVYVAPADSGRLFALDAPTGLVLWETTLAKDVVHLLGVGGERLWASGDKLWWIDVATGKVRYWPEGPEPRGFGRGVLAGDEVYWPTRSSVHVFDQRTGERRREIELVNPALNRDVGSGNLVASGDHLLVVGSNKLTLLGRAGSAPAKNENKP